jgi:hypothetical protein
MGLVSSLWSARRIRSSVNGYIARYEAGEQEQGVTGITDIIIIIIISSNYPNNQKQMANSLSVNVSSRLFLYNFYSPTPHFYINFAADPQQ